MPDPITAMRMFIFVLDDGRVEEYMDQWDAGRNLYERLPFIGSPIAFLRRRLSAH